MITLVSSLLIVALLGVGVEIGKAADSDSEAKLTMDERVPEATLKGRLMQIGRTYVWVTDKDGNEIRLHVEKSTVKQDKGRVGTNCRKSRARNPC